MNNDSREEVQERFGAFAQRYVTSPVHSMGYSLDRLIEVIAPVPGKRALDIATGGGHVALRLAQAGTNVIASDITVPMLESARGFISEAGITADYVRNDAQYLPFADNSFDIVTCRFAAHHFPDAAGYVAECARIVKPGGVVALMDQISANDTKTAQYGNAFQKLRDPSHGWEYNEREWKAMFKRAGLQIRHSETFSGRLDFNWWTKQQSNDADTVLRLEIMLRQAPKGAMQWLAPEFTEHGVDSYALAQMILIGEKASQKAA